jgi:hypothetical protein
MEAHVAEQLRQLDGQIARREDQLRIVESMMTVRQQRKEQSNKTQIAESVRVGGGRHARKE